MVVDVVIVVSWLVVEVFVEWFCCIMVWFLCLVLMCVIDFCEGGCLWFYCWYVGVLVD